MEKEILELLAPAGKLEVLKTVAEAGADAVYAGGKQFNMRMLRNDFNLSRDEIKAALDFLHQRNKKLYITVNNLYKEDEMEGIEEYLLFLNDIGVDALIIQDISLLRLHKELSLTVPLHASVQMGINNSAAIDFLENQNVQRIILSKNLSLSDIKSISQKTNLGLEYFVHGDMCISHTGQCYMSSFIFGQSGNQGLCRKPCRWEYKAIGENNHPELQEERYFLAHKDLCLYPYLRELIAAGIISFKIEGRMREADYLEHVVKIYRNELDRIINNQANDEEQQKDLSNLIAKRQRDFCSGSLYAKTSLDSIGYTGEREPYFPTAPHKIKLLEENDYIEYDKVNKIDDIELTVKFNDLDRVAKIINNQVNNLIIDIESLNPSGHISHSGLSKLKNLQETFAGKILLEMPRIMRPDNFARVKGFIESLPRGTIYGFIVNDLGSLQYLNKLDYPVWGGYGLNIANHKSIQLLLEQGVERVTPSLELTTQDIKSLSEYASLELMVHGPLCGVITDFCIPKALVNDKESNNKCLRHCQLDNYYLQDKFGQNFRIRTDKQCHNHIYFPYDIAKLALLPSMVGVGVKSLRIDGQFYVDEVLLQIIDIYYQAIKNLQKGEWEMKKAFWELLNIFPQGLGRVR